MMKELHYLTMLQGNLYKKTYFFENSVNVYNDGEQNRRLRERKDTHYSKDNGIAIEKLINIRDESRFVCLVN